MSKHQHTEEHFQSTETVRDIVIGMADGLTVPFALAAGLSGALASSQIVVTAGMAEIAAGAIAMGLGGYLAARTEAQHYEAELKREWWEVEKLPHKERREVEEVFEQYGLKKKDYKTVVDAIVADKKRWVDFMMQFELNLEKPDPRRAPISAGTIFISYIIGGLVPLFPYIFIPSIHDALQVSVGVTLLALFLLGGVKAMFTGITPLKGAVSTALIGGVAAAVAYYVATLFA